MLLPFPTSPQGMLTSEAHSSRWMGAWETQCSRFGKAGALKCWSSYAEACT